MHSYLIRPISGHTHGTSRPVTGESPLGEMSYHPIIWHRLRIHADGTSGKIELALDGQAVVRQPEFAEPIASPERLNSGPEPTAPSRCANSTVLPAGIHPTRATRCRRQSLYVDDAIIR
jgi:hypothetical protein